MVRKTWERKELRSGSKSSALNLTQVIEHQGRWPRILRVDTYSAGIVPGPATMIHFVVVSGTQNRTTRSAGKGYHCDEYAELRGSISSDFYLSRVHSIEDHRSNAVCMIPQAKSVRQLTKKKGTPSGIRAACRLSEAAPKTWFLALFKRRMADTAMIL